MCRRYASATQRIEVIIEAAEKAVAPGYPPGAGAVLLVELEGVAAQVDEDAVEIERICRECGSFEIRAATDARRLADIRYRGGATRYLEVLDSDTRMFSAELGVTQAELSELLSLVQIYRALGGGWQP